MMDNPDISRVFTMTIENRSRYTVDLDGDTIRYEGADPRFVTFFDINSREIGRIHFESNSIHIDGEISKAPQPFLDTIKRIFGLRWWEQYAQRVSVVLTDGGEIRPDIYTRHECMFQYCGMPERCRPASACLYRSSGLDRYSDDPNIDRHSKQH